MSIDVTEVFGTSPAFVAGCQAVWQGVPRHAVPSNVDPEQWCKGWDAAEDVRLEMRAACIKLELRRGMQEESEG